MSEETIYIVEDDEAVRDALETVLRVHGHVVEGFADGEAFFAGADLGRAKCLVLDVNLAGTSGLEILARLRAQGSIVPAVMVSGRAAQEACAEAARLGARAFLEKPVAVKSLLAAIGRDEAALH